MTASQRQQIGQRLKVGAIGLGLVVLLIVVAGAILGAVSRERAALAAGGVKPDRVAGLIAAKDGPTNEPLADMGVTPATGNGAAHP